MQFYENCANQKNWWRLAPRIRRLAPGGYCYAKCTKNSIFVNQHTTHLWCGAWRPIWCRQAVPTIPGIQNFPQHLRTLFQPLQFWFHSIFDPIGCLHILPSPHLRITCPMPSITTLLQDLIPRSWQPNCSNKYQIPFLYYYPSEYKSTYVMRIISYSHSRITSHTPTT